MGVLGYFCGHMKVVKQYIFAFLLLVCGASIVWATTSTSSNSATTSAAFSREKQNKISTTNSCTSLFDLTDIDLEEDYSGNEEIAAASHYKLNSFSAAVITKWYQFYTHAKSQASSFDALIPVVPCRNGSTPFYISLRVLRI